MQCLPVLSNPYLHFIGAFSWLQYACLGLEITADTIRYLVSFAGVFFRMSMGISGMDGVAVLLVRKALYMSAKAL